MTSRSLSAGVLRWDQVDRGGNCPLYFSNSLGAAVGVLVAGFYLVEHGRLPGTLVAAAMLKPRGLPARPCASWSPRATHQPRPAARQMGSVLQLVR